MKSKEFIYWLMGDRAGKATVDTWDWLWGRELPDDNPSPTNPQTAFATAEKSLELMRQSVEKLSAAVAQQTASYRDVKQKYDRKLQEVKDLEKIALKAEKEGREHDARLAIVKTIQLEKLLAQLDEQVKQAEQYVIASQNKLTQEQLRLEQYRAEIQNMRDLAEVNTALREIARVNDELDGGSAKSSLESAKSVVDEYNLQQKIMVELSQTDFTTSDENTDNNTADEVSRRLEKLRESKNKSSKKSNS
jgi:phage shock protein A